MFFRPIEFRLSFSRIAPPTRYCPCLQLMLQPDQLGMAYGVAPLRWHCDSETTERHAQDQVAVLSEPAEISIERIVPVPAGILTIRRY